MSEKSRVLVVFGSRPERLKLISVIQEFKKRKIPITVLFSGQHEAIRGFNDYDFSFTIETGGDRLNSFASQFTSKFSQFLEEHPELNYIFVQGDTQTGLVASFVAFNRGLQVCHIEAGCRTYENTPWPEEKSRRMISQMATIHFCATEDNLKNLENEKVLGDKYVCGQTGLDILPKVEISYENIIPVTIHRRESLRNIHLFFEEINQLAIDYPEYTFVVPIHYNPLVRKHAHLLTHVKVVEPLNHNGFLDLIHRCRLVISDSGGVQEEASFYKKKAIVLRYNTERSEALGFTSFLCPEPQSLKGVFSRLIDDYIPVEHECPFGSGDAGKKIVDIMEEYLGVDNMLFNHYEKQV